MISPALVFLLKITLAGVFFPPPPPRAGIAGMAHHAWFRKVTDFSKIYLSRTLLNYEITFKTRAVLPFLLSL